MNAGDPAFEVTAERSPVYLYKDLNKYDPRDVFAGLMRGLFLVQVSSFKFYCGALQ